MSNEASTPSFNSEGNEQDPFVGLDVFQHDPFFQTVLDVLRQKQAEFDKSRESNGVGDQELDEREEEMLAQVEKSLDEIMDMLDACDWIGSTVYVTGKLRVSAGMSDALLETKYFKENTYQVDVDDTGEYYYVNDLPMAMGIASMDEGAHSNHSKYILTFHTPDEILERADSEEEVEELLETTGNYTVYPDELDMLRFEDPSVFQVERTLRLYYPETYATITNSFTDEVGPSGTQILRKLQSITLPENNNYDTEILSQIGRYIAYKINTDQDAGYRFMLNRPIKGMSDQHRLVDSVTRKGDRVSGVIVGYDFDPGTRRVQMVVADFSPVSEGYELHVIPVDSVDRMHNLRPARSKFGSVAMKTFATIDDVKLFWEKGREIPDPSQKLFEDLDSFMEEASKQYIYNEREGYYEFSIDDDIAKLHASFIDHLQSVAELGVESIDTDALSDALKMDYAAFDVLSLGDSVVTQHKAVLLVHDQNDALARPSIEVLGDDKRLKGECVGFAVTPCPSEIMIETSGEVQSFAPALVMILKDASVFDDEIQEEYNGAIAVMLAPYIGTAFSKIQAVRE